MIGLDENRTTRARLGIMVATSELNIASGLAPVHLGREDQRHALLALLDQMGFAVELPPKAEAAKTVAYPVVIEDAEGKEVLLLFNDQEVLPALMVAALCKIGIAGAQRLVYRPYLMSIHGHPETP